MYFINLPTAQVEISIYPVLRSDYHQNGHARNANRSDTSPITNVSASDAFMYAARMGARLPEFSEILEFLEVLKRDGEVFPYIPSYGEWLNCAPDWAPKYQQMNCIAVINSEAISRRSFLRGSIQDRRYSFITFRIVKPHGKW